MDRIKKSFTGILVGIVLFFVGIGVLIFNEGNNVKNIKTVDEIKEVVVDVENTYNQDNEGKLININGDLSINENVTDTVFNIDINAVTLERKVEIYQWVEYTKKEDNKTVYTYEKEWVEYIVNSSDFKEKETHVNPESSPYSNTSYISNDVTLGDFELSDSQKQKFELNKTLTNYDSAIIPDGYTVNGQFITNGDTSTPQIGDVRISFSYSQPLEATILGVQTGNHITDYVSKTGKTVNRVSEGVLTSAEMINQLESQNNFLKWILRALGTLAIIIGIALLFGPISTLSSFVPILGGIVGGVVFLISFLAGLVVSLVTIAISWIVFRPLLGISLLVVAILLIVLIKKMIKNRK